MSACHLTPWSASTLMWTQMLYRRPGLRGTFVTRSRRLLAAVRPRFAKYTRRGVSPIRAASVATQVRQAGEATPRPRYAPERPGAGAPESRLHGEGSAGRR